MKRRVTRRQPMPPRPTLPAVILALDLGSLKTGWALARLDAAGKVVQRQSGCLLLEDVSAIRWKRIDHFAHWLGGMVKTHAVSYLAAEEAYPGAHWVIHTLFGMVDLASGRLFDRPVYPVARSAVYLSVCGWNRRAGKCPSKAQVMAAINARHGAAQGRRITSEDEADAIGVLDTLLAELAGTGIRQAAPVVAAPVRTKAAAATLFKSKLRVATRRPAA